MCKGVRFHLDGYNDAISNEGGVFKIKTSL